ncbi:MAG: NAD(P)/FAD-dependent oxidoreductase [Bacteroidales bacterium]|nr:NAD(P)/FAD-dependent oxidoreductase [Bacteroidales bacterium]
MNYDVIIIGAGLGGLTAGAKLVKEGKKVLLIEQHYVPGGCATTFQRKGYTVEVGLHELDGFSDSSFKTKIFKEFDVFNNVEFVKLPEFYETNWKGKSFVLPENIEKASQKLINEFPDEEKGIIKFLYFIKGIDNEIKNMPKTKSEKIIKSILFPAFYPKLVKSSKTDVGTFIDSIIKNEWLKIILLSNLSYYHDNPYTASLFYFAAGQASYYLNGSYFIKGGSQKLSDYLMKYIKDNGGEVKLMNMVNEIIIEKGKAVV